MTSVHSGLGDVAGVAVNDTLPKISVLPHNQKQSANAITALGYTAVGYPCGPEGPQGYGLPAKTGSVLKHKSVELDILDLAVPVIERGDIRGHCIHIDTLGGEQSCVGDISHLYTAGQTPSFSARFCEVYGNGDRVD